MCEGGVALWGPFDAVQEQISHLLNGAKQLSRLTHVSAVHEQKLRRDARLIEGRWTSNPIPNMVIRGVQVVAQ